MAVERLIVVVRGSDHPQRFQRGYGVLNGPGDNDHTACGADLVVSKSLDGAGVSACGGFGLDADEGPHEGVTHLDGDARQDVRSTRLGEGSTVHLDAVPTASLDGVFDGATQLGLWLTHT